MTSIALFGGSFNPPHIGHTLAVSYVLSQFDIDRVFVVPVFKHAFAKDLADYYHRREMVRLSMGWLPKVIFSDIEQELWVQDGGISRTLNTVKELCHRYPDTKLRLMVGSDIIEKRDKWYRFDEVERLAPPIVFPRVGTTNLSNVSSTFIRHLIRNDKQLANPLFDEALTPQVRAYIKRNHLYENG